MTRQIDTSQFKNEVLGGDGVYLVDFFATWCGPCQLLSPILAEIDEENENINVVSIDIDEENLLAAQEGIMSVPTMQVYKDGKKVKQIVGLMPKEKILAELQEFVG